MNIISSAVHLGQYLMYFFNLHLMIREITDKKNISLKAIPLLILYSVLIIMNESIKYNYLIATVLLFLSLNISHPKKILSSLYIMLLYLFADGLISPMVIMISESFIKPDYFDILCSSISLLLNTLFCLTFKLYVKNNGDNLRLSLRLVPRKIYILILLYVGMISVFSSYIMVASQDNTPDASLFIVLKVCIIFTSILSLFIMAIMIMSNLSSYYYKKTSSLLDKQLEIQTKYYEKINSMTNDIRRFRHDYKNHMICLNSLLNENKIDEAINYLGTISSNQTMKKNIFRSGNTVADVILNEKAETASENGCSLKFTGVLSSDITAFDICTILSNALDNSIEACKKLPENYKKYIDINCTLKRNVQIICISNPCLTTNPHLKTSKEDKSEHGFGIYNIKKTVEGLNGTVNISQKSSVFILDIIFSIPGQNYSESQN